MSQKVTHDIISKYLAAFNASDSEAMLALLHQDVAHDINQGERQIGKEQFRIFNGEMARHYKEELADIVIMVDEGGVHAAAEFTVRGQYIATAEGLPEANGQNYDIPAGIFFDVDDGLITRVTTYYNLKNWIAQVS